MYPARILGTKAGRIRSLGGLNVPFSLVKEHLPMYLKIVFALLTKLQYSHGRFHHLLLGLSRIGLKDGLTQNHVHTFINIIGNATHGIKIKVIILHIYFSIEIKT